MANLFELVGEIAIRGQRATAEAINSVDERAQGLARRIDKAGRGVSDFGDKLSGVGDRASRFSAAIAGVGGAAAVYTNSVTQAAEETLQWSNRLDVNIESLQVWRRVAKRLGIQSDALIDGFKELTLRADEFAETGKGPAAEVFERLGLSQGQVAAVKDDTEALFELVLGRIRQVGDASARQRIADELFGGQAGEQFTELLGKSRAEVEALKESARETGGIISREEAERAREFNNAMTALGERLSAVGQQAVLDLLPQLQSLVGVIEQNLVPLLERTVGIVQGAIETFSALPAPVQQTIAVLGTLSVIFGPILSAVGRIVGLFGSAISLVSRLSGIFKVLRVAALVPLLPIIAKVTAVGLALWAAWEAGKIIINWLIRNVPAIGDAIINLMPTFDQVQSAFSSMWSGLKSILESIVDGFTDAWEMVKQATIGRVMDMVDTVTDAIRSMWQTLTGNSIIPRMADEAIAEFNRMGDSSEDEGERMRRGMVDAMDNAEMSAARARGQDPMGGNARGGDGGRTSIDLSHSTFQNEADMLDRLRQHGADVSGAFG